MLLPLAWLVRLGSNNSHYVALMRMLSSDLLDFQQPSGAVQERLGTAGMCDDCPPRTNEGEGERRKKKQIECRLGERKRENVCVCVCVREGGIEIRICK